MRSGRTVVGTVNSWLLTTENDVLSKDLRTHLSWLMDKIEPSGQALKELQQEPGIQMSVRCYWESAHGDGGPTLWPEQMKRMAELNLEISLTCADYEEE